MRIQLIPRRASARPRNPLSSFGLAITAVTIAAIMAPTSAQAEICKYADPEGNIHYSNVAPEKGWKRVSCTITDEGPASRPGASTTATSARKAPTPAGFPRVDNETQKVRDDMRKKVLNEELAAEQKLLADARVAYADGAPPPQPDEKADAEKYRGRIAKLRQSVSIHERNVEALKKELSLVK
jgi:hypothetical protein